MQDIIYRNRMQKDLRAIIEIKGRNRLRTVTGRDGSKV